MKYDAVVLGLGGMGSATLAHLAARGKRVLGIEQFARGHELGASSGRSRIIRKAYFEDPAYVPLLERAYTLWHELEARTFTKVLDLVGLLLVGPPGSETLHGARTSAQRYGVGIEEWSGAEVAARYPGIRLTEGEAGIFERDAGIVYPEAGIAAHLAAAKSDGAQTRFETPVRDIAPTAGGIHVDLADGTTVVGERLVICAGPWLRTVVAHLALPLRVQRNVQLWFEPTTPQFSIDRFPAFLAEREHWPSSRLYGFPDHGFGVKAAFHGFGETTTAETLDRTIHPDDIRLVGEALNEFMPGAAGKFMYGKACMYTLTPDEHFILDRHPDDPRVVIAGGFSGHGYKFASVIGEICADLALDGGTAHPIGFLAIDRFKKAQAAT
jgi:sarcosine oxidase